MMRHRRERESIKIGPGGFLGWGGIYHSPTHARTLFEAPSRSLFDHACVRAAVRAMNGYISRIGRFFETQFQIQPQVQGQVRVQALSPATSTKKSIREHR